VPAEKVERWPIDRLIPYARKALLKGCAGVECARIFNTPRAGEDDRLRHPSFRGLGPRAAQRKGKT
jgi:hypothetical protein